MFGMGANCKLKYYQEAKEIINTTKQHTFTEAQVEKLRKIGKILAFADIPDAAKRKYVILLRTAAEEFAVHKDIYAALFTEFDNYLPAGFDLGPFSKVPISRDFLFSSAK
jgi:hypothetical protein